MVVLTVEETEPKTLKKLKNTSRYALIKKVEDMPEKDTITKIVSKPHEDKSKLTIEDILPPSDLKKLPAGKMEGYFVRKLILLKIEKSMEDDFIESSKKAIKKLKKHLEQTAEGQQLLALITNLKTAQKNKARFSELENDVKGDAKQLSIDLSKQKLLTGMEAV